jgi:hypothetical protein
VKRTKEEIVDVDFIFYGCELDCLSIAGWCVSEIGGVAWCELYRGGYKNNYLIGFSKWSLAMVLLNMGGCCWNL